MLDLRFVNLAVCQTGRYKQLSKYALVNIPLKISSYVYLIFMFSVTGRGLDNLFLFCKSLLDIILAAG